MYQVYRYRRRMWPNWDKCGLISDKKFFDEQKSCQINKMKTIACTENSILPLFVLVWDLRHVPKLHKDCLFPM